MLSPAELGGGLSPDHELFFAERPDDPEMRESTSIWLCEENGAFAITRVGIEGEAHSWDNRLYHGSLAFPDGRVLRTDGRGPVPSPLDEHGEARIFGAGPITFAMVEPFRRWRMTFDGTAMETDARRQIASCGNAEAHDAAADKRVPVAYEVDMEMVTPGWVQDNSPGKVAQMSAEERADAESMGLGWRIEHQFRAEIMLTLDGETKRYRAVGNRIKRQSVRPMLTFRGHVWQAALFPDGRAFAVITYPPLPDGSTYNDGYVFIDGRMHAARATSVSWLRRLAPGGEQVPLELAWDGGSAKISGTTACTTFHGGSSGMPGFTLEQSSVQYEWDGQVAYGMLERSSFDEQIEQPPVGKAA